MNCFFSPVTVLPRTVFHHSTKRSRSPKVVQNEFDVQKCEIFCGPRSQSSLELTGIESIIINKEFSGVPLEKLVNKPKYKSRLSHTYEYLRKGAKNYMHVLQVEAPIVVQTLNIDLKEQIRNRSQSEDESETEFPPINTNNELHEARNKTNDLFSNAFLVAQWDSFMDDHEDHKEEVRYENLNIMNEHSATNSYVPNEPTKVKLEKKNKRRKKHKKGKKKSIIELETEENLRKTILLADEKKAQLDRFRSLLKRRSSKLSIKKKVKKTIETEQLPEDEAEYRDLLSRERKRYKPSKVSHIKCVFGKKKATVPVKPDTGFGDLDIQNAFQFNNHQVLYIQVKAIKEKMGEKRTFPFIIDPELPYMLCLDRTYLCQLRDDMQYQVIVEDLREKRVADLTLIEIQEIRARFNEIDVDGSNELDFEEVCQYYLSKKQRDMEKAINLSKIRMQMADSETEIKFIVDSLDNRKQQLEKYYVSKIQKMWDTFGSSTISWDEFLKHEAVDMLKGRQIKSSCRYAERTPN
jgi:hypothetical protein